jgi:DNA repair exonuclease SbcCD ATPase subunit
LSEKCPDCIREDIDTERRVKRDLELEAERQRRQAEYKRQLQEIDDELDRERRLAKYRTDEDNQKKTLEQRRADLASLKESAKRSEEIKKRQQQQAAAPAPTPAPAPNASSSAFGPLNGAKAEWEEMKQSDGTQSPPMDELMNMIGLEEVKQEFLSVKSKVDLAVRQGTSLSTDRFSCSMLGNPGTGTTISSPHLRRH